MVKAWQNAIQRLLLSMLLTVTLPIAAFADEKGRPLFNFEELERQYVERQSGYRKPPGPVFPLSGGGGGVDSGGGTLVIDGAEETFLDLYNFPSVLLNRQPGFTLSFDDKAKQCGALSRVLSELPHFGYVADVLLPILDGRSVLHDALDAAFESTRFTFVNSELSQSALDPKAYVIARGRDIQLRPLATYIKNTGVVVSLPAFNRFRLMGQLAVFVHELLRQISIGLELSLTDKELQQLTSLIVQKRLTKEDARIRAEFKRSQLPAELDAGFFTPYSLRADLNFLCAWMENRGHDPSASCQKLEGAEAKDVYHLLASIKHDVLDLLRPENKGGRTDVNGSELASEFLWNALLRRAHAFRTTRIQPRVTGGARLLPLQDHFSEGEMPEYVKACSALVKSLKDQQLF